MNWTRKLTAGVLTAALALGGIALAAPARAAAPKPEKTDVSLSVGGKQLLYYLPLTITERLGYFKDAGLNVTITNFAGGSKGLEALLGGSADVTAGAYDHCIQMQARQHPIVAVVQMGRYPGISLGLTPAKAKTYKGPADLKGLKIGVTAPGSSTNFMVDYLLAKAGLKPSDVSFIGVGGGPGAVAAMRHGELDGMSNVEPVISQLESEGLIKVVADTRTTEGTQAVYGGPYPAAVLYTTPEFIKKYPNTTQALVSAIARGLKWLHTASTAQIMKVVPEEYYRADKALYEKALEASRPTYSPDGKFSRAGAENALKVLAAFSPAVAKAHVDLAQTYDERFIDRADK